MSREVIRKELATGGGFDFCLYSVFHGYICLENSYSDYEDDYYCCKLLSIKWFELLFKRELLLFSFIKGPVSLFHHIER